MDAKLIRACPMGLFFLFLPKPLSAVRFGFLI